MSFPIPRISTGPLDAVVVDGDLLRAIEAQWTSTQTRLVDLVQYSKLSFGCFLNT